MCIRDSFWGVQYHPEFSLKQIVAILDRRVPLMIKEGFRKDEASAKAWLDDMLTLDAEPNRQDLAWAHGLDREVLDTERRVTELRNFMEHRVKPHASARSRA